MKKGNKLIVVLIILLTIGSMVFAQGRTEQAQRKVELVFAARNTTNPTAYEEIFAAFKAKTGHTVELQLLPAGEEYGVLMQTRFATGDYPDLFEMDPGTKQYTKFNESNLVDLTNDPVIWTRAQASAKAFQTLEGKIYGFPWGATGNFGVYYNKDVFKAIGATEPQSYNELIDILKKAKAAGYIPVYDAVNTQWPLQIFSLASWPTYVDPVIGVAGVDKLDRNELRLNEIPAFREVLVRQVELRTMGLIQPNFMSGTYDDQLEQFGQGKVAVLFQLSGIMNSLRDKFGIDFVNNKIGWFPMPAANGPGIATLQPPSQILIPNKAKNVSVAIELAHFMTEKENLDIWYKYNPGVPAYRDVNVNLYTPELTVVEFNNQGKAMVNIQNRLQSSFADYPKLLQQMYIDGDVDKVLNMLDENYRRTGRARAIPGF